MTDSSTEQPDDGLGEIPKGLIAPLRKKPQIEFDIEFFRSILERAPDYVDVLRCQGELLSRKGAHVEALEIDRRLATLLPHDSVVHYNLACSLTQNDLCEEAIAVLRRALERGYNDFEHLELDADLIPLHADPRYRALIDEFQPAPTGKRRAKRSRRKS
jgi:tetratricopeptide (TPR) repeat protein